MAVAFPFAGGGSLVLSAYLSSLTGIGTTARELVLAVQTALWGGAMVGTVLVAGRLVVGALIPLKTSAAASVILGVLLATTLAYAHAAVTRAGGVLDADALGLTVFAPGALLATTTAHLAGALTPNEKRRPWEVVTFVVALLTAAMITYGLATSAADDIWLAGTLAAGGGFVLLLLGLTAKQAITRQGT
ncbi:MAG TPA: hypothetical protein VES62_07340 [Thermoleophilaceae bacterium]|nr:hypothetical protein [Thermoleophilaceae bacterium]